MRGSVPMPGALWIFSAGWATRIDQDSMSALAKGTKRASEALMSTSTHSGLPVSRSR
jgi:hypothetical protein